MISRFYRELDVLHVGCENPRAYYIPFDVNQDSTISRESSARFQNLCGEWDFEFFKNIEELDICSPSFSSSVVCHDKMDVPFCWQLKTNSGYDVPNYINQDYPFPVDPPHLPDVIPCGFYRRKANVKKSDDKKYYINLEGVSSCFYLWINGAFCGYSQVSHCTSEFDISDKLIDGENTFEVLVVKHCDGSYLEDQDFFRLSGIFREVYILERDKNHIKDIEIKCFVPDDFDDAEISVKSDFNGEIEWTLSDSDKKEISVGKDIKEFSINIKNPELWNSEKPYLYHLTITANEEKISFPVAIKRIEIKDRCMLLNGQKIKIRGINRHDSNPETGYAVSVDDMLKDLYILKRANVNTIRTSHYPNDPRFLQMCERLGFMIIDEADLESHGMGYNYGDWYWDYWSFLSDSPVWKASFLDRAERLFERDKNHGCIIMWSLGNESGCGENHRHMANYIRSRDSHAIIHYENARLEYQERVGKDFTDISDVESRMYASLDYLKEYLEDDKNTKPFFYCEYVDSTSTGDIPLHWDGFEEYDNYCGGCIWEFCDHAVNIGTKENPKYRYGGDFGDWPNNGISCIDGLVFPDRTPRPGYYDMKQTYKPYEISFEDNKIKIFNKRYFENLDDLYIEWAVECEGKVIKNGKLTDTEIPARLTKEYEINFEYNSEKLTTLNIYLRQKSKTEWAEKDFETGFMQFILSDNAIIENPSEKSELKTEETRNQIKINCAEAEYIFDKISGNIVSIKKGKTVLICEPLSFNMWRCCSYDARHYIDIWKRARYDHAKQKTYSVKLTESNSEKVVIETDISFAAAAIPPAIRLNVKYTFNPCGEVIIDAKAKVTQNAPDLPRFGLNFVMPSDFENTKYIGYGPNESYSDRFKSARISEYSSTVTNNLVHYVKPQECSSHYKTKFAGVYNANGNGIEFYDTSKDGFCFKALHFDDKQIFETMHDDELVPLDKTVVNIDYKFLASNQGLSDLEPWRKFDEKEFSFSYIIKPI